MPPFSLPALAPPTGLGLAQAIDGGRSESSSSTVSYGMSMWFEVIVEDVAGVTKLGRWTSCTGLGVKFATEEIKSSVVSRGAALLPVGLVYDDITLKRAMHWRDSATIRRWLDAMNREWVEADGSSFAGTNVVITLYSDLRPGSGYSKKHRVMEWRLRRVFPKGWKGPSLNASGNDLAMEELVLSHDGFLHETAQAVPKITVEGPGERSVKEKLEFVHFENYRITRSTNSVKANGPKVMLSGTPSSEAPPSAVQLNPALDSEALNISVDVIVDGSNKVADAVDAFFRWLKRVPDGAAPKTAEGETVKLKDQPLDFAFGTATNEKVALRTVTTDYKRFTGSGRPSRAKLKLSFEVINAESGEPSAPAPLGTPRSGAPLAGALRGSKA